MRPLGIVVREIEEECQTTSPRCAIAPRIRDLAQQRLEDFPLLAVCARRVGAREELPCPERPDRRREVAPQ